MYVAHRFFPEQLLQKVTTILSDLWGNRISITDPNAGTITATYDLFNRLKKQIDARNIITTFEYDKLGRIIEKRFLTKPDELTINYIYDECSEYNKGKGQLSKILQNGEVAETFNYNNYGHLNAHCKKIDNYTMALQYSYDEYGRLQCLTYPESFAAVYYYDKNSLINKITTDEHKPIYIVINRNKYQQPVHCLFKNNLTTYYTYNPYGLVTHIQTEGRCSADTMLPSRENAILNYLYNYDDKGLMTSRSESISDQLETYTYDNLDRLTKNVYKVKKNNITQTFTYTKNGNMVSNSQVGDYTYGSSKPHAVTQIAPINQNVIPQANCAVKYNFFNQPVEITEGDYKLVLSYGADQQRNKAVLFKKDTIINTRYYFDKYYEKEIDSVSGITRYYNYIYGDAGVVALMVSSILPQLPCKHDTLTGVPGNMELPIDSIYYIHTDHLGSYCVITNAAGQVVQRNCFNPWGNFAFDYHKVVIKDAGDTLPGLTFPVTRRGFTGHEHYPEFKIINMNGRLYDPVICRFFSPDNFVQIPEFTQSFNRYSYCLNNPLKYTDPSGEMWSPYYDIDGNFLGLDENGWSGDIYITTQEAFKKYKIADQLVNSWDILADAATRSYNIANEKIKQHYTLSPEAESKIATHILQEKGGDISNLYNDKVSVYDMTSKNGIFGGFNDPIDAGRLRFVKTIDGQFKVTMKSGELKSLGTVESVISYLYIHEYRGHGTRGYNGDRYDGEMKAYRDQYNHWTFKLLNLNQQKEIRNRMNGIW